MRARGRRSLTTRVLRLGVVWAHLCRWRASGGRWRASVGISSGQVATPARVSLGRPAIGDQAVGTCLVAAPGQGLVDVESAAAADGALGGAAACSRRSRLFQGSGTRITRLLLYLFQCSRLIYIERGGRGIYTPSVCGHVEPGTTSRKPAIRSGTGVWNRSGTGLEHWNNHGTPGFFVYPLTTLLPLLTFLCL